MKIQWFGKVCFIPGVEYNSNSVLVKDEKIMIIDPGLPDNYYLLGALESVGIKSEDVDIIVNTDCHVDHCGGNTMFPNAELMSGSAEYISAADPKYTLSETFGVKMKKRKVKKISSGTTISLGETSWQVIETPGHAPGAISLYEPELKILASGDVVFKEGVGRTDLPGGNIKQLRKSLEKLSKMDIDLVLPGHGEPCYKENILLGLDLANVLAPGVAGK